MPNIAIDFKEKHIIMEDGNRVLVRFFDTPTVLHQSTCRTLKYSDAVAIFYDVSDRKSFEDI